MKNAFLLIISLLLVFTIKNSHAESEDLIGSIETKISTEKELKKTQNARGIFISGLSNEQKAALWDSTDAQRQGYANCAMENSTQKERETDNSKAFDACSNELGDIYN